MGPGGQRCRGGRAYGNMATRMRLTADQLTQVLAKSGVNPATLKHRIRADMTWPQLVRGRFQSSLQIGEKDILAAATDAKGRGERRLRLHLAAHPAARPRRCSPEAVIEARRAMRKRCAAASKAASKASRLRGAQGCRRSRPGHPQLGRPSAGVAQGAGRHRGRQADAARNDQARNRDVRDLRQERIRGR